MQEIWKDLPFANGYYQVSNFGNVRSLDRIVTNSIGVKKKRKGVVLKAGISSNGYKSVNICLDGKKKNYLVHTLVAITYMNHKPNGFKLVVDHINGNKLDNRIINLQITTNRHNSYKNRTKGTSKYAGVSWDNTNRKWIVCMMINGVRRTIGHFKKETDAYKAYVEKVKEVDGVFIP